MTSKVVEDFKLSLKVIKGISDSFSLITWRNITNLRSEYYISLKLRFPYFLETLDFH